MTTTTPLNPTPKRGDVVLVLFPNSDLRTAKPRPALVIQADNLQTGLPQIIVAMISSQMARATHRSRVTVLKTSPEGKKSGLLSDSVVMTDNLLRSQIRLFTALSAFCQCRMGCGHCIAPHIEFVTTKKARCKYVQLKTVLLSIWQTLSLIIQSK